MSLSVSRPNPLVTTGDFSRRIRALEAKRAGGQICWEDVGGAGGSGIMFDTDPQEGEFLVLTTTDYTRMDALNFDLTTVGGASPDGHIRLDATGTIDLISGDQANIEGNFVTVTGGADGLLLAANRAGTVARIYMGTAGDPDGWMWLRAPGGILMNAYDGDFQIVMSSGVPFKLTGIPTSDPAVTDAVWADEGVLVMSGSSAGGSASVLLSTTTLTSDGTFDVSSISGAYNDLTFVVIARSTVSGATDSPVVRVNNDSGTNYHINRLRSLGTTVAASETVAGTWFFGFNFTGSSAPSNAFAILEMTFYGYASSSWLKGFIAHQMIPAGTGTVNLYNEQYTGFWNSTSAINRITITGSGGANLLTGSQLRIYGRG